MTPDGLVRWYYTLREDVGAPSLDLVKSRGRIYAEHCESTAKESRRARSWSNEPCPSTTRVMNKDTVWVCGRCGTPWRYWDRLQLRGEVQESKRRDGFEHARGRHVDVGVLIARFLEDPDWRWESRLYVANANGRSIRRLVQYGPSDFPEAPFPWNRTRVHELVVAGRREWMRRLGRAGIDFDRF